MMISHELAILVWVRRLEVHSGIVHAVQMVEPLCSFAGLPVLFHNLCQQVLFDDHHV